MFGFQEKKSNNFGFVYPAVDIKPLQSNVWVFICQLERTHDTGKNFTQI